MSRRSLAYFNILIKNHHINLNLEYYSSVKRWTFFIMLKMMKCDLKIKITWAEYIHTDSTYKTHLTLNLLNFTIIYLLKWNNQPSIFGTLHYHFFGVRELKNLKLVSQQYRAWSDFTDVQAGLALYRWQRLICDFCLQQVKD